ncbi:MAG: aldo/keto reductase [Muribaculaceae bacterium]|nr:aldo/keto reductase [Muribaculaceae bacterium]
MTPLSEAYTPSPTRYDDNGMKFRRAGKSGILLPEISLGLWQNFGDTVPFSNSRRILHFAFDHGITHFDLANNYGPSYGSAEETFGKMMRTSFAPYRDELFISSKAGYDMWPGPYGNWGSRKYLTASLNQSLKRMNLEYVDIFYIHRYDPSTPLDETLQALVDIVRCGKALYVGISRWPKEALAYGLDYLDSHQCHCLLFQDRFNILDRAPLHSGCLDTASTKGTGFISFSPLAQGLLTNRYLNGIPEGSRAGKNATLNADRLTPDFINRLNALNEMALQRGQSLAQMALAWILNNESTTSVLVGASSEQQLADNISAIHNCRFTNEELDRINALSC